MKFLVDMPLSPGLAVWLCGQEHDAVHAAEIGLHRANDTEIMDRARRDARVIVTADLDYPHLLALARATEPGVILFRDGEWSSASWVGPTAQHHCRGTKPYPTATSATSPVR